MKSWIAPYRKRLSGKINEKRNAPKEKKRKIKSIEVDLGLGGNLTRENMPMPGSENGNEARIVWVNGFKKHGDLKMYIQLPDYDDFQCYDLGVGGVLSPLAHKIYANFHNPP